MTTASTLAAALSDRYRIERELGQGGMATVYLAEDLKHHRQVAIKVLRPELAAVIGAERFLREIKTIANLQHPHILGLIDSGEVNGTAYYVMPYVEGESVRDRLDREKQFPVADAVRIATEIAGALDYAHRHGVIHRDLKPENILLQDGVAMLADFGIALAVEEAGGPRLTETGLSLGTPRYMSPEQATGEREIDRRADIYSLGAVLYELLSGDPPHTGSTVQAVIAKLVTEQPTRLRLVRNTVPPDIETAVAKALAKLPGDRFRTAAEFGTALQTGLFAPESRPAPSRRNPVAGLVALLAVVGIALVWRPWNREDAARKVGGSETGDAASVAVLPFDNLTGNPDDAYLSDGMTEEVIGQLAQIGDLKVISRTSTEALKGTNLTLRQIAETLGVRHILEGSVRHADNRIRVTVDLIDANTDAHIWSSRYDRALTDVFAVQEEIARNVADSLVKTVGVSRAIDPVTRTESPGAYEAYLAGRSMMYRRTREGLRGALDQFRRAIAEDSTYAPAYTGLASVYFLWLVYNYSGVDLYDATGRALAAADRAIAIDPDLAEAYAARGITVAVSGESTEGLDADFARALELRPSSANIHQWYASVHSRLGRHAEALAEAERAIALDPLSPGVRTGYSAVALAARRYDIAEREAARAVALEPSLMWARGQQALGALLSGHAERCLAVELGPFIAERAMCLHTLGRPAEAVHVIDSLRTAITRAGADTSFSQVIARRGLAEYYAWVGNVEASLTWLDSAYALSPSGEDFRILASGVYDPVRKDPRFSARVRQIQSRVHDRVSAARRRS